MKDSLWESLFWKHRDSIVRYCSQYCASLADAEDLTQEVFVRAQQNIDSLDTDSPVKPWLLRVARNLCLNHIRDGLRHKKIEKFCWSKSYFATTTRFDIISPNQGPKTELVRNEENINLHSVLDELTSEQREAILLRYFDGLTRKEICTVMECNQAKVKRYLYEALIILRKKVKKDEPPSPFGCV
ncbi:MAG: RNA polymerase sigma factor [Planctomycetes bacterium]|nr:RNA polymerase sigma factor [Planctomycetota bacterium]